VTAGIVVFRVDSGTTPKHHSLVLDQCFLFQLFAVDVITLGFGFLKTLLDRLRVELRRRFVTIEEVLERERRDMREVRPIMAVLFASEHQVVGVEAIDNLQYISVGNITERPR